MGPVRPRSVHGREDYPVAEAQHHPAGDQAPQALGGRERGQQGQGGGERHREAEHALEAEAIRQPTARDLRKKIIFCSAYFLREN